MGAAEGIDLHALVVHAHHRGYAGRVAVEVGERADDLRCHADIRDGELVAVAEATGLLLAREMALDGFQCANGPVREPAIARGLVLAHLLLQIIPDARRDQRMAIGCGDQREPAYPRAATRILR